MRFEDAVNETHPRGISYLADDVAAISSHATASRNNRRNLDGDRSSINQRIMLAGAYATR